MVKRLFLVPRIMAACAALGVALWLLAGSAHAALDARIDHQTVARDDSLVLTLRSDSGEKPDLSPLKKDFEIVRQSSSNSIQMINGTVTRSNEWQITLAPKRSGRLQIPPLSAGTHTSQALDITVTDTAPGAPSGAASPATPSAPSGDDDVMVDMLAEPKAVYVQQQVLVTVRVWRAVNLGNRNALSDPQFPGMDATVTRVGDDRSYQTSRNGRTYVVFERVYAVNARNSGSFTSEPVEFEGDIVTSRFSGPLMMDPFAQARHIRLRSAPISLTIKPIPAGFSGSQWLPASRLQLSEQWSAEPKFNVGEPITRSLILSADGLPAAQLPSLDMPAVAGLKLYPDQPVLKNNPGARGLAATREQKTAIIPTQSGSYVLPAVDVKWWNVDTDKEEVARLPAHTITATGAANPALATQPAAPAQPAATPRPEVPASAPVGRTTGWWPWLALLCAVGWLLTAAAWWRARRPATTPRPEVPRDAPNATTRHIQTHCLANDPHQTQQALLAWARQRWPEQAPASLNALARRCPGDLASALLNLDAALYAKAAQPWHGGAELWRLFSSQATDASTARIEPAVLEPLYRT